MNVMRAVSCPRPAPPSTARADYTDRRVETATLTDCARNQIITYYTHSTVPRGRGVRALAARVRAGRRRESAFPLCVLSQSSVVILIELPRREFLIRNHINQNQEHYIRLSTRQRANKNCYSNRQRVRCARAHTARRAFMSFV